jgi:hypothetical protein
MKPLLCLTVPAVVVAVLALSAAAEPVADTYAISPDAGPWVICAASFLDGEAIGLAHQLVDQLRSRYHLQAYIFDWGDDEKQKDLEEHRKKEALLGGGIHLPFRHPVYRPSCAVLIGGFSDMESATAALAKVKLLPRPDLKLSNGSAAIETEYAIVPDAAKKTAEQKSVIINQLSRSFVTRNPTIPTPKAEHPKFDPAWKELNAPESYSLLKNAKQWTLVVKEYNGATCVQNRTETTSFWDKLGQMGHKPGEAITAAGYQAHQLAEFLRDKHIGFDAYVLHTKTGSIVTVGGFASLNDPEMERIKHRLQTLSFKADARSPASASIKGDPIGLLAHPLPMEVPHY